MASVIAFGGTYVDIDWSDQGYLKAQLGGSCANVVAEISVLGGSSSVITKISDDNIGKFLIRELRRYGVNTNNIVMCDRKAHRNTLNIICRTDMGFPEYITYNINCAEHTLTEEELSFEEIAKYDVFHFASNTLTSPNANIVDKCIDFAKKHGCKISYDVNYRPGFWESKIKATNDIKNYIQKADFVKMNEYEAKICVGDYRYDDMSKIIGVLSKKYKNKIIIVTCADKGSYVLYKGIVNTIEPKSATLCDDIGAGDAYFAVFLYRINVAEITNDSIIRIAQIASDVASLSVEYQGTVSAFQKAVLKCGINY